MEGLTTYTLGELSINGKGSYGIGAPAVDFSKNKYMYLRITDINDDGTLSTSDRKSVDDPEAHKYVLHKNDIVFARTGNSTGRAYFYDERDGELVYAGFLIKFSLDPTKVNPKVLKYYTHSKPYYDWVKSFDTGATRGNINAQTFASMPITLPDKETQDRIVDILSAIDNKIRLNNRINHNLEEQADGIVSSLLNVGTTVLRLSDICKYVSQRIDCQSLTLDNYISTENMVPSRGGVTKSSNVPTGTAIGYSSGDILVSNIRPYFQKIWKATYSGGCSNDVLCFRSSTNSPSFLYHLLRQNSFFDHVMAGAKGSKMPRGDKAQIMNWTFVLSEDWEAMESKLFIIDKKVALLRAQNLMLIELRDSVLPRLMSGELEINDLTC